MIHPTRHIVRWFLRTYGNQVIARDLGGLGANGIGGFSLQVFASSGSGTARIYKTDNTYPGSDGQVLIINASFEF